MSIIEVIDRCHGGSYEAGTLEYLDRVTLAVIKYHRTFVCLHLPHVVIH